MKIGRWEYNEIIYTDDIINDSVNLMESFDFGTDILGANMVVSGMMVTEQAVPDMTVQISAGIAKDSTVGTFLIGEALNATITASDPVSDRKDVIEIRRVTNDITPSLRQFKDPVTGNITAATIYTETEYKTEVKVLAGTPGAPASSVEAGWIKIAEVLVQAASTTVVNTFIYNVDADKSGDNNTSWSNDLAHIYRNGTVSEMKTKIIDNETDIGTNVTAIALNTTHRGSDGTDHADVVSNTSNLALLEPLVDPIGGIKKFATYKDRSAKGLEPIALNNKVSTTGTYADLYADVGDTFEEQHVAAGDAASGAGYFYPTPVPGGYERAGVPDSAVIDATTGVDDTAETILLSTSDLSSLKLTRGVIGTGADGIPVQVKLVSGALPGGLAILTTYFCRFKTTTTLELYTTEAYSIDTAAVTGRVNLTDAVGTFSITQEGVVLGDAMHRHGHKELVYNTTGSGGGPYRAYAANANINITSNTANTTNITDPIADANGNGTPRESNESRGRTNILFAYIKAFYVM